MTDIEIARPLPALTEANRPYWTSGGDGRWRLQKCTRCERLFHPPALRCPYDRGIPEYVALSGKALVESWTVNRHPFFPGFLPPPYVIAFVNPIEDDRVRVLTNLVGIAPEDVFAGLTVRVGFERHDDDGDALYVPVFAADT